MNLCQGWTALVIIVYLENSFRKQFWLELIEWELGIDDKFKKSQIVTKQAIFDSVIEWATLRLRPILMTAFTSIIGLFPMITSIWVWSEVQKPLAIVVVWWLFTSILLTLIVLPVLFSYLRERQVWKIAV